MRTPAQSPARHPCPGGRDLRPSHRTGVQPETANFRKYFVKSRPTRAPRDLARYSLVEGMDPRWHRRLRVSALLILAALAAWPSRPQPAAEDEDRGAVAVSTPARR